MSRALGRFVGIMNALTAATPDASLAQIASATGLDKSTAHRLLGALEAHGLVRRDAATKRYSLGTTAMAWGAAAFAAIEVRAIAEPVLRRLHAETRETISLWVRDGACRVCVWTLDAPQLVRHVLQLGLRLPLSQGAGGKLTLALLPEDEALALLAAEGLDAEARARIVAEFPAIRRQGYALSIRQMTSDAWSMAVPVFDRWGAPASTIVLAGPTDRLSDAAIEGFARLLLPAAAELSRLLGAPEPVLQPAIA